MIIQDDAQRVKYLLTQLNVFSDFGIENAYSELRSMDEDHLFNILAELILRDEKVWMSAARAALQINTRRGIPLVLPLLYDLNSGVRHYVCGLLSKYGDARAIEPLIERLTDPDPDVRHVATFALGEIGDSEVIPELEMVQRTDSDRDYEGRSISEMAFKAIRKIRSRFSSSKRA